MFILVPLALLFLCFAYLNLNVHGLYTEIFVYSLMIFIIFSTYLLYSKIQNNIKQQEINIINLEILELEDKVKKEIDTIKKDNYLHKISKLKSEINKFI